MAKKTHDLVVKMGEYEADGKTKNRYENIGSIMANDDGGRFLLLKRTFNLAGVPGTGDRDSVLVSVFSVEKGGNQAGSQSASGQAGSQAVGSDAGDAGEIPF